MPNHTNRTTPAGASETKAPALLRINKALALAGVCSRRAADELVAAGRITVNGSLIAEAGTKIDPAKDEIAFDGKPVTIPHQGSEEHVYLMMNKPIEVMTTLSDPQGRRTILDILTPEQRQRRVFPIGRLDYFSEGLLLMTTDGELANRLTHPRWHLPKLYLVRVRGDVTRSKLEIMRNGMRLREGEELAPIEVRILPDDPGRGTVILMTLIQGINRQIRRMCRDLNLTVLGLRRIQQGPIGLDTLERGKARELTAEEVSRLKQAVGMEAKPAPPEKPKKAATPQKRERPARDNRAQYDTPHRQDKRRGRPTDSRSEHRSGKREDRDQRPRRSGDSAPRSRDQEQRPQRDRNSNRNSWGRRDNDSRPQHSRSGRNKGWNK
ncbi:pseudouridine synthase [Desulfobaculum bizertense]|uniref:pseudouridine synthase n=1 Tax=Desulfobaculum bizertense TaxID=376490 RepID=UPI001F224614|nr:pseudouridine synthase [Desulfobaculum bizertense]UIJ38882.1 pseudouridine synthase [Desulfobaculum bizertense]